MTRELRTASCGTCDEPKERPSRVMLLAVGAWPATEKAAALESLPAGETLVQVNERVPQFLLPRLAELGFEYEVREPPNGPVRTFIRRRAKS